LEYLKVGNTERLSDSEVSVVPEQKPPHFAQQEANLALPSRGVLGGRRSCSSGQ